MAFADAADGGIARHLAEGVDILGEEQNARAGAVGGEGGFEPGMTAAHDKNIEPRIVAAHGSDSSKRARHGFLRRRIISKSENAFEKIWFLRKNVGYLTLRGKTEEILEPLTSQIDHAVRRWRLALSLAVAGCAVWFASLAWSQVSLTPNPYEEGYDRSDLAATKGEGTAENPFRIYNIWQLQAIDGVVPQGSGLAPEEAARAANLFGESEEYRLSRHYVLAQDIDATVTREWNEERGFNPIRGSQNHFSGVFDGGGHEVRGVWVDRPDENNVGLFGLTGSGSSIVSVGVVDGNFMGDLVVGGLVGLAYGDVSSSWSSSTVSGKSDIGGLVGHSKIGNISSSWSSGLVAGQRAAGGLVGSISGGSRSSRGGNILSSWSSSSVLGEEYTGGLIGYMWEWGSVSDSWASGLVSGGHSVGGLMGYADWMRISSSWSSGVVLGTGEHIGGLLGRRYAGVHDVGNNYWSIEASGRGHSPIGIRVYSLQTISVSSWSANTWRFGGDRDFPVLSSSDADLQAAGIANGLTRLLGVGDGGLAMLDARMTTAIGAASAFTVMQLDTNGLAPNEGDGGETSKPVCDLRNGVLAADTGYNGVTVMMRAQNAVMSDLQPNCKFVLRFFDVPGEAALSVDIVAGAITMRRAYNLSAADGDLDKWQNDGPPIIEGAGSTIFIAADAAALSPPVAIITARDAGAMRDGAVIEYSARSSPDFDVSQEGGTVLLVDSALGIFGDEDGKELTLIIAVSDGQVIPMSASATFFFRSEPRAVNGGESTVTIRGFRNGAIVLPLDLVKAKILHAEESYSLDNGHGLFAANPDDGVISLTADIFDSGEWTVVLQASLADGALSSRQTIVFRTPPPPIQGDNGEEKENPFDYGYENGKGEGTAEDPFQIYNIEQLQAIEGVVAPEVDLSPEGAWKGITLFGASDEERLSRHYILMNDIDAVTTRVWNGGEGFDPIGTYNGHLPGFQHAEGQRRFKGVFNGNGHRLRGLWINRPRSVGQALFAFSSYAQIMSVGLVDARIVTGHSSGVLVAYNAGTVSRSWATDSSVSGEGLLGGLVGIHAVGLVEESWFSGSIVGYGHSLGGVAGNIWYGYIDNSWSSGSVKGGSYLGGFVGYQNAGAIEDSWTAAAVAGDAPIGGFVSSANRMNRVYWSVETSEQTFGGGDRGRERQMHGVGSLQTVTGRISEDRVRDRRNWDREIWDFGDSELGEGDRVADFPALRFVDSNWQAVGIASGLTRVLGVGDGLAMLDAQVTTAIDGATPAFAVLQLDTNGLAPNEGDGGETSKPVCDLRDGVLTADTGYNGAVVMARAQNAVISDLEANCEFVLRPLAIPSEVVLSVAIVADTVTIFRAYNLSVAGLLSAWENDGPPAIDIGSSTVLIDADATASSPVTLIKISDEGARRDGAVITYQTDSTHFSVSANGEEATIVLLADATEIFDEDGKEVALTITINDGQASPMSSVLTLFFRSKPRAIDGEAAAVILDGIEQIGVGQLVLSESSAAVWHSDDAVFFDLAGDDEGIFGVDKDSGRISLARIPSSQSVRTVTLRAQGSGLTATQEVVVSVSEGPLDYSERKPEKDEDGYYLIYNIWQLQAIGDALPSEVTVKFGLNGDKWERLFGRDEGQNPLTASYRLANNIDASATEEWDMVLDQQPPVILGAPGDPQFVPPIPPAGSFAMTVARGFSPIKGDDGEGFSGVFDGGGYAVYGLRINRSERGDVGLFGDLVGATISNLGIIGQVVGGEGAVGGLAGSQKENSVVEESWFSGRVEGEDNVGGLIGGQYSDAIIQSSWSSGAAGGLVGYTENAEIVHSWSLEAIAGELDQSKSTDIEQSYHSSRSSGQDFDYGIEVDSLQTISDPTWDPDIWSFGGTVDFPVLRVVDSGWQAAGIANGLTRVLGVGRGLATLDARGTNTIDDETPAFAVLQLDTNGLAPNDGDSGETSKPVCDLRDGVLTADTGYNGAVVMARAQNAVMSDLRANCEFVLRPLAIPAEAVLSVAIVADAVTILRAYNLSVAAGLLNAWENDGPPAIDILLRSATVLIDADATASSPVTLIKILDEGAGRDGAVIAYQTDSEHFSVSASGEEATIVLLADTTEIFDEDGKEVALTIAISDGQASPMSSVLTLFFRSKPRAIDGEAAAVILDGIEQIGVGQLVLSESSAAVWHSDDAVFFDLAGDDEGIFGVDKNSGRISLARIPSSQSVRTVTLRAQGSGLTATQEVVVSVSEGPLDYSERKPEKDEDGYYLIYNIWQLQAIGDALPSEVTVKFGLDGDKWGRLFGRDEGQNPLTASYRLANNIDASATEEWDMVLDQQPPVILGAPGDPQFVQSIPPTGFDPDPEPVSTAAVARGFSPIEGDDGEGFSGVFDGGGYAVYGLRINRSERGDVGLFGNLAGATVSNLGIIGQVVGGEGAVGGLAGRQQENSVVEKSWFSGRVEGEYDVGGLIGGLYSDSVIRSSWSLGAEAGLVGYTEGAGIDNSWSLGAIVGEGESTEIKKSYWSSGSSELDSIREFKVDSLQTISVSAWDPDIWSFGGTVDFPVLRSGVSVDAQAAGLAYGLTRVEATWGDGETLTLGAEAATVSSTAFTLSLDANFLADADDGANCKTLESGLSVLTNYNGAKILAAIEGVEGRRTGCSLDFAVNSGDYNLILTFSADDGSGPSVRRRYRIVVQ